MQCHKVVFACNGRDVVFAIDVVVADSRSADAPTITPDQYARYRDLELSHGGVVPLTPEEFEALVAEDPGRVAALASFPGSNLYPLLRWGFG
jgi:hypothetical protein